VLSEFRDRLADAGLVKRGGRQRTDSTHVLAAVRRLNRVELVAETLRAALEALVVADEIWLAMVIEPAWLQRYGRTGQAHIADSVIEKGPGRGWLVRVDVGQGWNL
jgi:hypothetical protein